MPLETPQETLNSLKKPWAFFSDQNPLKGPLNPQEIWETHKGPSWTL